MWGDGLSLGDTVSLATFVGLGLGTGVCVRLAAQGVASIFDVLWKLVRGMA